MKIRKRCLFCGARKYTKYLKEFAFGKGREHKEFICRNADQCVRRASLYKK